MKVKLVRSTIAHNPRNRATVEALGLRKIGQVVEQPDNSSIRGMIHKISHMLVVETAEGAAPVIDAMNPGSSSRMLKKSIHHKFDRKPNAKLKHGSKESRVKKKARS